VTLTAGIQGDIIEVVEPLGSLWCVGKLVNTNKSSGFFCTVFVQPGTMPHEVIVDKELQKNLAKAMSMLVKLRRQSAALSKEEFRTRIAGKPRKLSLRRMRQFSEPGRDEEGEKGYNRQITRFSSVAESIDKVEAETQSLVDQLHKQYASKTIETDEEAEHKLKKRSLLAQELLETERSYVFHLEMLVQNYLNPLRSAIDNKNEIISSADIKNIFGGTEVIYQCNSSLLKTLEQRLALWTNDQTLSDIFFEMTVCLKAYNPYLSSYGNAVNAIDRNMTNPRFIAFLKDEVRARVSKGISLEDLLFAPIQRIPRYVLVLQELAKCTPFYHRDFFPTLESLAKVKQFADKANEYKREFENSTKVLTIQQSIISKTPLKLFAPHRRLVREGKLSEMGRKPKPRHCFLFNDLFLVTKSKKQGVDLRHELFLTKQILLHDLPEEKGLDPMFEIVSTSENGSQSLVLSCPGFDEKMEWMRAITNAIANFISVVP